MLLAGVKPSSLRSRPPTIRLAGAQLDPLGKLTDLLHTPAVREAIPLLERQLSDLVNVSYGLTPKGVALMWRTAPPRMPLDPAEELRRMGTAS